MKSEAVRGAGVEAELTVLRGIGPARAEAFRRLHGISSVGQLLCLMPTRYEEPARVEEPEGAQHGDKVRLRGKVVSVRMYYARRRGAVVTARLEADGEFFEAVWFGQGWRRRSLEEGQELFLEGRVQRKEGAALPTLLSPRAVGEDALPAGLQPVYPDRDGLSSGLVAKAVAAALPWLEEIRETLPQWLLQRGGVPPLPEALRDVHRPPGLEEVERARRRLAWGEILTLERQRRRATLDQGAHGPAICPSAEVWQRIRARIPFTLTEDQERVLHTLSMDLESGRPMRRLLHGEVGSGKTAVAFALALAVAAGGGQVALLAPTEILARQHLATFRTWLKGSQVQVVGLLGDDRVAARRQALAQLKEAAIAIGTHALFGPTVHFGNLRLVIFDEQHRFGVRQKAALVAKGKQPHVLTMTATPIPRTLAWARYGALEPCQLRSRPNAGATVRTRVADLRSWPQLAQRLRPQLEGGARHFVVTPRIDGPGGLLEIHKQLNGGAWRGMSLGVVHGRLPGAEVEAAVESFRAGRHHALLGTSIVEVGLDVAAVPGMVVLGAQRFGLASLHQLRGRLARGPAAAAATCWLLGATESLARLMPLESIHDGFQVADLDLAARGPGALRGVRQHGPSGFQVFDPERDEDLVARLGDQEIRNWAAATD